MSRGNRRRPRKVKHTVELAIADISLAEDLLGQNQTLLRRFVDELSTLRARLAAVAQLLDDEDSA